jgi:hypothetical protein
MERRSMYFFEIVEKTNNYVLLVENNKDFESFLEYYLVEISKYYNVEDFKILYSQKTNKVISINGVNIIIDLHYIKEHELQIEYRSASITLKSMEKDGNMSLESKEFVIKTINYFEKFNKIKYKLIKKEDCSMLNDEKIRKYLKIPQNTICEIFDFTKIKKAS